VIATNLAAIARAEGVGIEPDALTLIARAAEGSVRDAQSLLDQALVQAGDGERVSADAVRDMLGLSDRALTVSLLETIAQGQGGPAIAAFRELHALGADPATVVMDLLEHCHAASVAKTLGPEALRLPKDQAARLTALGVALSAGSLSRLWQMLLKGLDETRSAPDPAAAVDMLLIRLAFAADLPGPEEALRAIRGGGSSALAAQPAPLAQARHAATEPRSFQDVALLAEAHRDIALKFDIERYVRPISFRPGAIEFEPAPGAPSNLAQRLVARLKEWTGQPWLVATDSRGGSETLDELHKQALARAHGEVLADPFVKAVLDAFPGTEILEVRELTVPQVVAPDPEPNEED
jgi:DNA polymerase-3 subunit gamma/tau